MSKSQGRGRGQALKISKLEEGVAATAVSDEHSPTRMGEASGASTDPYTPGRGGYRAAVELITIPANIEPEKTKVAPQPGHEHVNILANFVPLTPMKEKQVYQYRVDFTPNVESVSLRSKMFREATAELFPIRVTYDGVSDARSSHKTEQEEVTKSVNHPAEPDTVIQVAIKRVGIVTWGSFEMLRLYNMHMKMFLKKLGFFPTGKTGTFVHPALTTNVGESNTLVTIRGYKTAANVHDGERILMNLESTHKLMQRRNVLQYMGDIRQNMRGPFQENIRNCLIGKLVITSYNKTVYKIEDVNFDMSCASCFRDERNNRDISYVEYYQARYNVQIGDPRQPMLLVQPNATRRRDDEADAAREIYLVPELCNIAGLTDQQRNDNRIKTDLIRSSQVAPNDRVKHLETFLKQLHDNADVKAALQQWGYAYDKEALKIRGRLIERQAIGIGRHAAEQPQNWPKVDASGGFDKLLLSERVARAPKFPKLAIIIGPDSRQAEGNILAKLKQAFTNIGCPPEQAPHVERLATENQQAYVQAIRQAPADVTACIVIVPNNRNKDKYDTIKKTATVEKGMITQVVTASLMNDERKARGASIKIAVQVAAKIGGEPWVLHLPLEGAMICGYDTYHDSVNRGRSYGAFMASMNTKFSRWWSKVDSHDVLDELSANMATNMQNALEHFKVANQGRYPLRVFVYRDGVGDGQLEHVYNIELNKVRKAIKDVDASIKFTFIVVNKRIGARFYMKTQTGFDNPPPGTVVDSSVTRANRYDFYLISQSTRHGTVTPTYYNILADESGMDASKHQMMAFKLCFMYYNWTGTVRVPAPCQYAHKLALLCGEHTHAIPNAQLDHLLHFL